MTSILEAVKQRLQVVSTKLVQTKQQERDVPSPDEQARHPRLVSGR